MKPAQRGLGIGFDHLETTGGRDRYVRRMVTHQDRMSRVGPIVGLDAPKAAFGGGKFRTPQPASDGGGGKSEYVRQEQFKEVGEAFRRVLEVHGGARKSTLETRMPKWQETLADKISRNRKLGSKQTHFDAAHAAELYHQRRRISANSSLTERKKNKLDPDLFPVYQMRSARHSSAAELLAADAARRASGLGPRPASARATCSGSRGTVAGSAAATAVASGSATSGVAAAMPRPTSAGATTRSSTAPAAPGSVRGSGKPATASAAASAVPSATMAAVANHGDVSLGKATTDVGVLRRRLLERIVDRRLFRETELRPFLLAVVRSNKHFDAAVLKEAVRDVEREFFLV